MNRLETVGYLLAAINKGPSPDRYHDAWVYPTQNYPITPYHNDHWNRIGRAAVGKVDQPSHSPSICGNHRLLNRDLHIVRVTQLHGTHLSWSYKFSSVAICQVNETVLSNFSLRDPCLAFLAMQNVRTDQRCKHEKEYQAHAPVHRLTRMPYYHRRTPFLFL